METIERRKSQLLKYKNKLSDKRKSGPERGGGGGRVSEGGGGRSGRGK